MTSSESHLAVDRANRELAMAVFTERLDRIKADIAARGVGSRVADTLKEGTSDALDAGLDVAKERKGLIAGTFGALLLWIFREPLFTAAAALVARIHGGDDEETKDEFSDQNE
jgi:hypothetical protein